MKREWIIDNPKVHEKEGDDVVLTNMKKLRKLRFSDVLEYAPIIFETEDENSFHSKLLNKPLKHFCFHCFAIPDDETNSSTTPETSSFMISKSRFINYAPTVKYRRPELGESSQRNIIKIN